MITDNILAEIITSGSEITLGQMVDTNSAWMSAQLGHMGLSTVRHTSIGDDFNRLVEAFKRGWQEHQIILVTGGLGPTEDDLTRPAAAKAFDCPLEFSEKLAEEMRGYFARRGYNMPDNNLRQAHLPQGAKVIENPNGTAPGFYFEDDTRLMAFMPGVPREMKYMVENWLKPFLRAKYKLDHEINKTVILKTSGLGEGTVDDRLADLIRQSVNPVMGLLAGFNETKVLLTAKAESEEAAEEILKPVLAEVEKRLTGYIFSRDEKNLPQALTETIEELGLKVILADGISGHLLGLLAPELEPAGLLKEGCLVTGLAACPQNAPKTAQEIVLRVTAEDVSDDLMKQHHEARLAFTTTVVGGGLNNGKPIEFQNRFGGRPADVKARAAGISAFHLWRVLNGFMD